MKISLAGWKKVCIFALGFMVNNGRLAEGLGTGLQNLLLRFKSGSDLQKEAPSVAPLSAFYAKWLIVWVFFCRSLRVLYEFFTKS